MTNVITFGDVCATDPPNPRGSENWVGLWGEEWWDTLNDDSRQTIQDAAGGRGTASYAPRRRARVRLASPASRLSVVGEQS